MSSRGPYIKLTAAQILLIGKQAAEHGTMALHQYLSTFPPCEYYEH